MTTHPPAMQFRHLAPLLASLGLALSVPAAHASGNVVTASACQVAANGSGEHAIHQVSSGAINTSSEPQSLICPVIRPAGFLGASVSVDFGLLSGSSMSCTLYSSTPSGKVSASRSFTAEAVPGGSGFQPFNRLLTLAPEDAPYTSYQSLICSLAPHRRAIFRGLIAVGP